MPGAAAKGCEQQVQGERGALHVVPARLCRSATHLSTSVLLAGRSLMCHQPWGRFCLGWWRWGGLRPALLAPGMQVLPGRTGTEKT